MIESDMLQNFYKFVRAVKQNGWSAASRKTLSYVARNVPTIIQSKHDVISYYESILGKEFGLGLTITPENVPEGSMTWVIPDFSASSGGHINILRMMGLLREHGFPHQHVVIMEPHRWSSPDEAQAALIDAFGENGITVSLGIKSLEPCYYLVATGWQTAYWVAKYRDACHKLYFIQDFEPAFFAHGSDYIFAENTYKLGLMGITAGTWLAKKLHAEYGMRTFPFSFGCDTEFYRPHPRRPNGTKHIFFYARPVTPRRCFEVGLLALRQVCEKFPDAAVIFAGWDVSNFEIPFPHLNAGTVGLNELPDLYSQCDVALILSATNLSLLPLEVAACGCPVVLNSGPQSSWLLSGEEAFYCDLTVDSVAATVEYVINNPQEASTRAAAALELVRASSWNQEAEAVAAFLKSL